MAQIPTEALTEATLAGDGVFDVLMRATKAHLDDEFKKNRIKGPEYATVYLGSLESVMATALQFLIQREKTALEAELLQQQILLAQVEVQKADAALRLAEKQILLAEKELEIQDANLQKIPVEIAHIEAQTQLVGQQFENAKVENAVLQGQKCKLDAEFDLIQAQTLKSGSETALLTQKMATEKAQVSGIGVDANSVIGRQLALYQAQADGFKRDAEQKAAKIMVDAWNIQRTTDEGVKPTPENKLQDAYIGQAVSKMLAGVNA